MNIEDVFRRGAAAVEADDLAAAHSLFSSIVQYDADAHPAWNALALVSVRSGQPELAVEQARRALSYDKRNPIYLNNLGVAYGELQRYAEAEEAFRRALKVRPVYAEGMFNLGKVLHKQGKLQDSLRAYEKAYAMDPEFPGLRRTLAHMCRTIGKQERAIAVLQQAKGDPLLAPLLAECRSDIEESDQAIEWLRKVALEHRDVRALQFSLALALLARGCWSEGWKAYAFRRTDPKRMPGAVPQLQGDLAGRTVWLRGEQGLGDVLLFLRYAPQLRCKRAGRIVLSTETRLFPLLSGLDFLDELTDESQERIRSGDEIELWIGDLPAALASESVPRPVRLRVDPSALERMRAQLSALGPGPYLAVTWRAGTDVVRGREFGVVRDVIMKETPLEALARSVGNWQGTILSLQRKPYAGELDAFAAMSGRPVVDASHHTDNLVDLLALLSLLDEYVAVSNTNMHLLAGIGRTARVLVPHPPEWRWMRTGDESPWFPGFRVYRQLARSDWSPAFARLREDLEARI